MPSLAVADRTEYVTGTPSWDDGGMGNGDLIAQTRQQYEAAAEAGWQRLRLAGGWLWTRLAPQPPADGGLLAPGRALVGGAARGTDSGVGSRGADCDGGRAGTDPELCGCSQVQPRVMIPPERTSRWQQHYSG